MADRFRKCFEGGDYVSSVPALLEAASAAADLDADDAFWLSKCLLACCSKGCLSVDEIRNSIIYLLQNAFSSEISTYAEREIWSEAVEMISRLYIQKGEFDSAKKHLMMLVMDRRYVCDQVQIYYLLTQVMSDLVLRIVVDPKLFFERMDAVSSDDYSNRAKLYRIFLKRLHDISAANDEVEIDVSRFEALSEKYIGDYLGGDSSDKEYAELDSLYQMSLGDEVVFGELKTRGIPSSCRRKGVRKVKVHSPSLKLKNEAGGQKNTSTMGEYITEVSKLSPSSPSESITNPANPLLIHSNQVNSFETDLYGRPFENGLKEIISKLAYHRSARYRKFLYSILIEDHQPQTEMELTMLNMLYYSIFKEIPIDMGFVAPQEFISYLKSYPFVCTHLLSIIPFLNGDDTVNEYADLPVEMYCPYSSSDVLAAFNYWNWNSRIPVREDYVYLPTEKTHLLFITLDAESTYFGDIETLQWKVSSRLRRASSLWQKYIKIKDSSADEIVYLFVTDQNSVSLTPGKKRYYYLGNAVCDHYVNENSLTIFWKLSCPIPKEYQELFIIQNKDVTPTSGSENDHASSGTSLSYQVKYRISPEKASEINEMLCSIVTNDVTQTPYKYSLLFSVIEVCQHYSSYARELSPHNSDTISLPLGLVVMKWIRDYYPVFASDTFIALKYGESSSKYSGRNVVIRTPFMQVISYYEENGGVRQLLRDLTDGHVPEKISQAVRHLIKVIRQLIISNPMKHFGYSYNKSDYSIFNPALEHNKFSSNRILNLQDVLNYCGYFSMDKDLFAYLSGDGGGRLIEEANLCEKWREILCEINSGIPTHIISSIVPKQMPDR